MILLCVFPNTTYPFCVVDTDVDKMTFLFNTIQDAVSRYLKKNYRKDRSISCYRSKGIPFTELNITDLCTASAEKTEAAIFAKYPELLL